MATTNLHSIDNIEINGMDFKHLETTKDIVITLKNKYGRPAWPDTTHKWTAKVSDGTNYVGDYAVKINATNMIIDSEDFTKLPVGNYQLEVWEQWTDTDGASQLSIYPSPQQTIPFHIYANIPDQAGKQIKEIGFQDVVDQAVTDAGLNLTIGTTTTLPAGSQARVEQNLVDGKNQFSFYIPVGEQGDKGDTGKSAYQVWLDLGNTGTEQDFINTLKGPQGNPGTPGKDGESAYQFWLDLGNTGTEQDFINTLKGPQGDKGDTGSVDNAGLTNAPAFQALQTDVNAIKAAGGGVNLLTNTSDFSSSSNWGGYFSVSTTTEYNGHPSMVFTSNSQQLALQQVGLDNLSSYAVGFWAKADNAGDKAHTELFGGIGATDFVLTTNWVRYTAVLTSCSDTSTNAAHDMCFFGVPAGNKGNVYIALPKLEKGSVATDWCPNPTEVLTQADYAKIKAAIVALGGSLS